MCIYQWTKRITGWCSVEGMWGVVQRCGCAHGHLLDAMTFQYCWRGTVPWTKWRLIYPVSGWVRTESGLECWKRLCWIFGSFSCGSLGLLKPWFHPSVPSFIRPSVRSFICLLKPWFHPSVTSSIRPFIHPSCHGLFTPTENGWLCLEGLSRVAFRAFPFPVLPFSSQSGKVYEKKQEKKKTCLWWKNRKNTYYFFFKKTL